MQTARQGSHPNGATPFLSLSPVQYSLTDGTSIPAPPPPQQPAAQLNTLAPPPTLSVPRTNSINSNNDGSTSLGGPLSSHPVTPLEEPADPTAQQDSFNTANAFPDSYNWSRPTATSTSVHNASTNAMSRSTANGTNGTVAAAPNHHATQASADSNNFDPALPAHIPSRDTSRRPSLVERFLPRLRSSSFMRSRSSLGRGDSSSNLSQQQSTTENGGARGVKRPASPFGFGRGGGSGRSESERPGSRGASSTFPRMVRKKSMELLSTARRRSGMWGRDGTGSTASAMAEERERERLREVEDAEEANRLRVQAIRAELERKQPPPRLPELVGIGGAGGAGGGGGVGDGGGSFIDRDMFANVGG